MFSGYQYVGSWDFAAFLLLFDLCQSQINGKNTHIPGAILEISQRVGVIPSTLHFDTLF